MTKTFEKKVLKDCIKLLKKLEIMKWITHFERMNIGLSINMAGYFQRQGKAGTSDLIAFVPVDKTMWVMFFEVKRPSGGFQSKEQKEFEMKFLGFINVIYQLITDASQIKKTIEQARMTSLNYGKIGEWELPESIR